MLNEVSMFDCAGISASSPTLTPRIIPGLTKRSSSARRPAPFPRSEIAEIPRSDAEADETQRRQAHCGGHAAHLPVAAFAQPELDPGSRDVSAAADGWVARPEARGLANRARRGRTRRTVSQHHAGA